MRAADAISAEARAKVRETATAEQRVAAARREVEKIREALDEVGVAFSLKRSWPRPDDGKPSEARGFGVSPSLAQRAA